MKEKEVNIVEESTKKSSTKKERNKLARLVFDILFWIIIGGLILLWGTEIILTKTNKEPLICINEKIHQYDDGQVIECHGIGYKTYEYNRKSINIKRQFGAFFTKMKK